MSNYRSWHSILRKEHTNGWLGGNASGQSRDDLVQEMVGNAMLARTEFFKKFLDPRRDIDDECGYPKTVSLQAAEAFRDLYDRMPIATRVVQLMPKECWQVQPSVYEDEDSENVTPFEQAWDDLAKNLRGEQCWYKDEQGNPVWEHLQRADILSGIGHYGILLLGIDDGKPLNEPVEGVATEDPSSRPNWDKPSSPTPTNKTSSVAPGSVPFQPAVHPGQGKDAAESSKGKIDYGNPSNTQGPASSITGTDAQYVGVQFGPSEYPASKPSAQRRRLLFLRAFDESLVQITSYESDIRNPRFGMPKMYRVTLNDPREQHSGIGLPLATVQVHWSRVIHLADNLGSSEIFGVPRMRPVLNRILDLNKLYGGSAEMYWRGAFPGLSIETVPQLGGDVEIDKTAMKDMMEDYMNGLQRFLMLMGMSAKSLAPQVVDPSQQIAVQIEAICIQLGCPIRIFKGSERGELASSQDDSQWNDRIRNRQNSYLTPRVIIPLIDRLISVGVLPEPAPTQDVVKPPQPKVAAPAAPPGGPGGGGPPGMNRRREGWIRIVDNGRVYNLDPKTGAAEEEVTDRSPSSVIGKKGATSDPEVPDPVTATGKGSGAQGVKGPSGLPFSQEDATEEGVDEDTTKALAAGGIGPDGKPLKEVIKAPGGYSIEWPDLDSLGEMDKANVANVKTTALAAYVAGNIEAIIPPSDYLTKIMGMDEEEANSILTSAAEAHEAADTMTMPPAPGGYTPIAPEGTMEKVQQDQSVEEHEQGMDHGEREMKIKEKAVDKGHTPFGKPEHQLDENGNPVHEEAFGGKGADEEEGPPNKKQAIPTKNEFESDEQRMSFFGLQHPSEAEDMHSLHVEAGAFFRSEASKAEKGGNPLLSAKHTEQAEHHERMAKGLVKNYNPDQERDASGRWASGGGAAEGKEVAGHAKEAHASGNQAKLDKIREHIKEAGKSRGQLNVAGMKATAKDLGVKLPAGAKKAQIAAAIHEKLGVMRKDAPKQAVKERMARVEKSEKETGIKFEDRVLNQIIGSKNPEYNKVVARITKAKNAGSEPKAGDLKAASIHRENAMRELKEGGLILKSELEGHLKNIGEAGHGKMTYDEFMSRIGGETKAKAQEEHDIIPDEIGLAPAPRGTLRAKAEKEAKAKEQPKEKDYIDRLRTPAKTRLGTIAVHDEGAKTPFHEHVISALMRDKETHFSGFDRDRYNRLATKVSQNEHVSATDKSFMEGARKSALSQIKNDYKAAPERSVEMQRIQSTVARALEHVSKDTGLTMKHQEFMRAMSHYSAKGDRSDV